MADALPELHSRQLRAVLALVEYRSFVAAAAGLKVSQPALTRTIKQLEAKLGVLLFSRSTREVAATDAGKEFAALAERLINDLKIGIESVRERASEPRGQVVVASVISLASLISPRLIADFAQRFGGVEIYFREGLQSGVRDDGAAASPISASPTSIVCRGCSPPSASARSDFTPFSPPATRWRRSGRFD